MRIHINARYIITHQPPFVKQFFKIFIFYIVYTAFRIVIVKKLCYNFPQKDAMVSAKTKKG